MTCGRNNRTALPYGDGVDYDSFQNLLVLVYHYTIQKTFPLRISVFIFSQVLHNGEYGTVCDDGWDLLDANVVCNMLNMGNASRAVIRAGFGAGTKKIWLDEVQCFGKSWTECLLVVNC